LPEHLQRLRTSSDFFSRPYDEKKLVEQLDKITQGLTPEPHAIHIQIDPEGDIKLSVDPYVEDRSPVVAELAKQSIDVEDIFLYHHTTNRTLYDEAAVSTPGVDEVLLWNEKGEVTESCTSNIIIEQGDQYITPPVNCGLLPGTYRSKLLQEERFTERPIMIDELKECDKVYLINSLVGWREVSNWGQGNT
jgi:para-aminobenzoate synthetase/4-amino-4-deoxychorismate lyase